ncbi:MAG: Holliday junction branch migration protein RuvA [Flavobacteriales bacterium]
MYDYFNGKLADINPAYAVIECQGVGYHLNISLGTFTKLNGKNEAKLYAHLIVREDIMALYGFADKTEREMFRLLINVSGVGAGTARMILSSLSTVELREAVSSGNLFMLKSVKGVGEKTAQRILIDLKGKMEREEMLIEINSTPHNTLRQEALTALNLLGFQRNVSEKAIDKVMQTNSEKLTVEQLIKQALKNL